MEGGIIPIYDQLKPLIKPLLERTLGGIWKIDGSTTKEDTNGICCFANRDKKDCYPLTSAKNKRTNVQAYAMDQKGELKSQNFEASSSSWVANTKELLPKVNAWIFIITKKNPNILDI